MQANQFAFYWTDDITTDDDTWDDTAGSTMVTLDFAAISGVTDWSLDTLRFGVFAADDSVT